MLLVVLGLGLAATASAQNQPSRDFHIAVSGAVTERQGDIVHLSRVTFHVNGITFTADQAEYNANTQEVEFRGSVRAKLAPRR
jgi:hypothetical protein